MRNKITLGALLFLVTYSSWAIFKYYTSYTWATANIEIQIITLVFSLILLELNILLYKKSFFIWIGMFIPGLLFYVYLLIGNIYFTIDIIGKPL